MLYWFYRLNEILNDLQAGERENLTMTLPPTIMHSDTSIVKLFITNPTGSIVNWSLKRKKNCSCANMNEKSKSTNCPHARLSNFTPKSGSLEVFENELTFVWKIREIQCIKPFVTYFRSTFSSLCKELFKRVNLHQRFTKRALWRWNYVTTCWEKMWQSGTWKWDTIDTFVSR